MTLATFVMTSSVRLLCILVTFELLANLQAIQHRLTGVFHLKKPQLP